MLRKLPRHNNDTPWHPSEAMSQVLAHADPLGRVLLALAVVLLFAKLGGYFAERVGQPSVLGELVIGVVLGNLGLGGIHSLQWSKDDATLSLLANLGAVISSRTSGSGWSCTASTSSTRRSTQLSSSR